MASDPSSSRRAGAPEMLLPDELRSALDEHFGHLRKAYRGRGWGGRVGFGKRPAVIVIDLALAWTKRPDGPVGSDLDPVVEATVEVLEAARASEVPVFFTTGHVERSEPPAPVLKKFDYPAGMDFESEFALDPRLGRRPGEILIAKPYDSAFKGTHLSQMLSLLGVDTLIVTGCSTGHCVYATCRDAVEVYHLIVPAEAVGDRCEIMHMVNLLDIDVSMGDVLPVEEVVEYLSKLVRDV